MGTYRAVSQNNLGDVSNQTNTHFDYTAKATGLDQVQYHVAGDDLTDNSYILFAINDGTDGNTPPQAQDINLTSVDNANLTVNLSDYISDADADGDELTVALVTAPSRFSLAGNQVSYVPDGFVGLDNAVYSVTDTKGGVALAHITVLAHNSSAINTPPMAQDYSVSIDSATTPTWSIDLQASGLISDVDGDPLKITHLFDSNNRAQIVSNTSIAYTPADFVGIDHITYRVIDNQGGAALGQIVINVTDSDPDIAVKLSALPQVFMVDNGDSIDVDLTPLVSAENADTWALTALSAATKGSISNQANRSFSYSATSEGVEQLTYTVSGNDASAMSEIIIGINDPNAGNQAPQANNVVGTS
ncbi:Ig-like domain-containing protein [Shewanella marina]|uniref:Ig-like domain-containing protein n=1 Tax=Shewanella marina TaxID=487319 RepID=UPI0004712F2A|nr:Ig-like domain-containing protein [Shewanella marina]